MTRTHTSKPVWTWKCDECGREHLLGRTQRDLPSLDEMRDRGWFIAKKWGDKCPACVAEAGNRDREASEIRALFAAALESSERESL